MMGIQCPNCASVNTEYIDHGDWLDCHCLECEWLWAIDPEVFEDDETDESSD
jgi:hypothetical protein